MACGDGCEAEPVEESVGQRDAERRAETDPPRAMGAARGLGRQGLADQGTDNIRVEIHAKNSA